MPVGVFFLGLSALWLPWLLHASLEWRFNPQYGYGWAVPLLAAVLACMRWREIPYRLGIWSSEAESGCLRCRNLWLMGLVGVWLAWWRVVSMSNPDWRLAAWVLGLGAAMGVWLALTAAGGSRLARLMGFACLFPLVATPWPSGIEEMVVGWLRATVASGAVELAGWLGRPAMRMGNLIVVSGGVLGVDEACSGIRSLQSGLMAALFLGEFWRLRVGRRLVLLGFSAVLALVLNLLRTTLLVAQAADGDLARAEGLAVHDPAGWLVFSLQFFALLGLAWVWRRDVGEALRVAQQSMVPRPAWQTGITRLGLTALAVGLLATCSGSLWFAMRGAETGGPVRIAFSESADGYRRFGISSEIRRQLRHDSGRHAEWVGELGELWQVFVFDWAGGTAAAFLARAHSPEVCLPATGLTPATQPERIAIDLDGNRIEFAHQRFAQGNAAIDVFHRVSGSGEAPGSIGDPWSFWNRFRLAWQGRRQSSSQAVTIGIVGLPDSAVARRVFARGLRRHAQILTDSH